MNKTVISKINGLESLSDSELRSALSGQQANLISNVNWPKDFPYAPSVSFRMAYSDKAVSVLFEVQEDNVKAAAMESNGPVWEDSCVEFFIGNPAGEGYFNFEMNCIGTLLAAKRRSRTDFEYLSPELNGQVRRFGSLEHKETNLKGTALDWWIIEVIPFELLGLGKAPEKLRANLYKCGDKCETPHFLSWSPIGLPNPDFHCPDFFGEIVLA